MSDDKERELRLLALQLAIPSSASGERKEEVIARAEAYLAFMKGTNNA